MIYFTSDLHFYHANIIKHANRPFYDIEQMNKTLLRNWNDVVHPTDEVYLLGDVTMKGPSYAMTMLRSLKGKKYLIRGNHDRFVEKKEFDSSIFEWIKDYYEFAYQNQWFVLCHYPLEEWNGFYRGAIHLHGHQHNRSEYNYENLAKGLLRYDVGVDANGMRPVSIEDILTFFTQM